MSTEDAESSSDAESTVGTLDEVTLLRKGSSFDMRDCSFDENNDAFALRLERGVEGTLEGRLEREASEAEGVRGKGEVTREVRAGFLSDEREGGGGSVNVEADSRLRCSCKEARREAGALWGSWG